MIRARPADFPPEFFRSEFQVSPPRAGRHHGSEANEPIWPREFGIISAYATTGEVWPAVRNEAADQSLEHLLRSRQVWLQRIVVAAVAGDHREPSWAVALPWPELCEIGCQFLQLAIYYVAGDQLFLSFCDQRRGLVPAGEFRGRIRWST